MTFWLGFAAGVIACCLLVLVGIVVFFEKFFR